MSEWHLVTEVTVTCIGSQYLLIARPCQSAHHDRQCYRQCSPKVLQHSHKLLRPALCTGYEFTDTATRWPVDASTDLRVLARCLRTLSTHLLLVSRLRTMPTPKMHVTRVGD